MRRLLVLALLGGIMFALRSLEATAEPIALDALTFAALGFVILAAHVLSELASAIGVPRVTGYILAGIAVGPQAVRLLEPAVVRDMEVFQTLALALIALEAGLELHVATLRRLARTLSAIVLFKIPLSWLVMGGTFLAVSPFIPVAADLSWAARVGVGLILGALSVGTSPAISVAVISEYRAKGKLPDVVLALAVFKDVVMIVMLAVATAAANVLITDGATLDMDVFVAVTRKLVLSLAAGAALGALMIAWMRWVRWELVLTLILAAYGVNALCEWLHLKMLLVFIAAGFTVANFSPYGHDLHKPLAFLALPVFIVFFTRVGANLDLTAAASVAPFALILFVARGGMMYAATRLGGWLSGAMRPFTDKLWLGFISQAGVALGLLIVAREAVPALSEVLEQVGTVLIAMNLLIGPFLLRRALAFDETALTTAPLAPEAPAAVRIPLRDPALEAVVVQVERWLAGQLNQVDTEVIGRWEAAARARAAALGAATQPEAVDQALAPLPLAGHARHLRGVGGALRSWVLELPEELTVPHTPLPTPHGAPLTRRARLRLHRTTMRLFGGRRRVPVRTAVRVRVEGTLVPELVDLLTALAQSEAAALDRLGALAAEGQGTSGPERQAHLDAEFSALSTTAEGLRHWLGRWRLRLAVDLADALCTVGTPTLPRRQLRFRRVSVSVDRALRSLDTGGLRWDSVLGGVAGRARIHAAIAHLDQTFAGVVGDTLAAWQGCMREAVANSVVPVAREIAATDSELRQCGAGLGRDEALARLESEMARLDTLVRDQALPCVDALRRGDEGAALGTLEASLAPFAAALAETMTAVPRWVAAATARDPDDIEAGDVALRAIATSHMERELAWGLEHAYRDARELIDMLAQRLGEVAGIVSYGLRLAAAEVRRVPDPQWRMSPEVSDIACGSLDRARRILDALHAELTAGVDQIVSGIHRQTRDAVRQIGRDALGHEEGERRTADAMRWLRRLASVVVSWTGHALARLVRLPQSIYRDAAGSGMARELRIRRGVHRVAPREMAADVAALGVGEQQRAKVPYVLAKLFDTSALDAADTPVGADTQIGELTRVLDRFAEGRPAAVLVTGPEGVGKSSVARATLRRHGGADVVGVALDPLARTEAGFCSALGAGAGVFSAKTFADVRRIFADGRHIVLLDGLEHAFLRTAAGLEHVRRILRLVGVTRDHVCWVVTLASPTARLLELSCDLHSWFTDRIAFAPLGPRTLGDVIDARCRLSGYRVVWPAPDHGDGALRRLLAAARRRSPEVRRRLFFERLARESGGNIRDAMALWLCAVDRVDADTVLLRAIQRHPLPWFDQLGRDAHRLLAVLVQCGTLTLPEAEEAIRWRDDRTRAAFVLLEGAGLAERVDGDTDRFRIWPPVWRRMAQRLTREGLLPGPETTP